MCDVSECHCHVQLIRTNKRKSRRKKRKEIESLGPMGNLHPGAWPLRRSGGLGDSVRGAQGWRQDCPEPWGIQKARPPGLWLPVAAPRGFWSPSCSRRKLLTGLKSAGGTRRKPQPSPGAQHSWPRASSSETVQWLGSAAALGLPGATTLLPPGALPRGHPPAASPPAGSSYIETGVTTVLSTLLPLCPQSQLSTKCHHPAVPPVLPDRDLSRRPQSCGCLVGFPPADLKLHGTSRVSARDLVTPAGCCPLRPPSCCSPPCWASIPASAPILRHLASTCPQLPSGMWIRPQQAQHHPRDHPSVSIPRLRAHPAHLSNLLFCHAPTQSLRATRLALATL